MLRCLLLPLLLVAAIPRVAAQRLRGVFHQQWIVDRGDSIAHIDILPVYVFSRPVDLRRYRRMVEAVKRVYPMAQAAKAKMREMEGELLTMNNIKLFGTTVQENIYNGMWNYGAALSLIMLLLIGITILFTHEEDGASNESGGVI